MSQISMFSYKDGPKSQLLLRGTPIAAAAQGHAQVEYQNGNAQISAKVAGPAETGLPRRLHDVHVVGADTGRPRCQ